MIFSITSESLQALDHAQANLKSFFLLILFVQSVCFGISFSSTIYGAHCSPFVGEEMVYPWNITAIQSGQALITLVLLGVHSDNYFVSNWVDHIHSKQENEYLNMFR